SWMQSIGVAPPEQKKNIGRYANELKQAIEERWAHYIEQADANARPTGAVDVTLPGRVPVLGHRHPLTVVRDRMEEIFTRMGFAIVEGPEVEDEWHCFDALNMPAEHPARDMQDTLYLAAPLPGAGGPADLRTVLRTRLSPRQSRFDPHADVHANGRARRRRRHFAGRSQRNAPRLGPGHVRRTVAAPVSPQLLSLHRAERRS